MFPEIPENEALRLEMLRSLCLLDSEPEASFDDIVSIMSSLFGCPIAAVSLIDTDRQWFKSIRGFESTETDQDSSFCGYTILRREPLIVADATKDIRFRENPLVTGELGLRFYAGAPIVIDGLAMGTVCIADFVVRTLTGEQAEALAALARQTGALIEARRAAQRARASDELLRSAAEVSFDTFGIMSPIENEEGRIVDFRFEFLNQKAIDFFGFPPTEFVGLPLLETFPTDTVRFMVQAFARVLNTGDPFSQEYVSQMPAMKGRWVRLQAWPADGKIAVSGKDIHDRRVQEEKLANYAIEMGEVNIQIEAQKFELERKGRELEAANVRLQRLATTDGLTGLLNHRAFQERLEDLLDSARKTGRSLALALVDVDRFKAYNDDRGHQAGDVALKLVARSLESTVRPGDFVARYGGEEFVVVMSDIDVEDVCSATEQLRIGVERATLPESPLTVSVGAAIYDRSMSRQELIETADRALYGSKRDGRNRVTLAPPLASRQRTAVA